MSRFCRCSLQCTRLELQNAAGWNRCFGRFVCNCGDFSSALFLLNVTRSIGFAMTRNGDYLCALESAIRIRHKCNPTHRQTVFVRAKTQDDETVWEGLVEEFDLTGHRTARTCYAWRYECPNGSSKIIAVLRSKLIDSAQKAVEAAIFTDAQPPVLRFSDDLKLLSRQLQECKDLIRKMGIKSEDLSVSIESARQIKDDLWRKKLAPF